MKPTSAGSLAALFALALLAHGTAQACSAFTNYERLAVMASYDELYDAWLADLSEKMRHDADPEIAYAGWLLDGTTVDTVPPPPPPDDAASVPPAPPEPIMDLPTPTTGLGRLLRRMFCARSDRCDDSREPLVLAEPDNVFVLEYALGPDRHGTIPDLERLLAQATRYDDYFAAGRRLPARLAAHYDLTPPPPPPGYVAPPCSRVDEGVPGLIAEKIENEISVSRLAHDDTIGAAARLHAADLMVAAKNTPFAAERGVWVGLAAADSVPDRERYCRLKARVDAVSKTMMRLMPFTEDSKQLKPRFYAALDTRNAIDAAEMLAREDGETPPPLDEAKIAACVSRAATDTR